MLVSTNFDIRRVILNTFSAVVSINVESPYPSTSGALLLEQGRVADAEMVYREDLGLGGALPRAQIHPDNLWALRGLLDCLERRGETAEAVLIRQRVELAAARADLPVSVSCLCARGTAG